MQSPFAQTARALAVALLGGLLAFSQSASATTLNGAGATFPAPLYQAWIGQFHKDHPETAIRYDAVGSGEGLARFSAGKVDFAGSDVAVSKDGVEKIERGVVQFPATAGLIVLAYNLPGFEGALKLPRDVYADIFLGKVRTWNDARIAAANPGVKLPATTITPIGRADSSGTTYNFTSHLAAVSGAWTDIGPGVGKVVAWPSVTVLARGNEGVAAKIKISEGSIGYVEYGFARRLGLPVAALENKEGRFVAPSPEAGATAIASSAARGLDGLAASLVNPAGAGAYPIVAYSWLVLHRAYPAEQARDLKSFVHYALDQGQNSALDLGYIPLPRAVADLGAKMVDQLNAATLEPASIAPK
jgi:phosphate transport system substrate-binding protein